MFISFFFFSLETVLHKIFIEGFYTQYNRISVFQLLQFRSFSVFVFCHFQLLLHFPSLAPALKYYCTIYLSRVSMQNAIESLCFLTSTISFTFNFRFLSFSLAFAFSFFCSRTILYFE